MEAKGDKSLIHTGEQGRKEVEAFEANLKKANAGDAEAQHKFVKKINDAVSEYQVTYPVQNYYACLCWFFILTSELRLLIIMERERQMTSRRR
mmetsp:Transcript_14804/g.24101  ORF Transcript_14804/g.24101 Transcript_14804/m.24101 type:complete len:93 (+) Transcript_14804:36-314(+)